MKTCTLLFFLLICLFAQSLVAAELKDVSIIQLIANPKDYDGKIVRVIGFLRLEFEGNGVYLHQEDYKHSIYKNGLWVDVTEDMEKQKGKLNQRYVLIEGTFVANMKGHFGMWSGSIQKITRCEVSN